MDSPAAASTEFSNLVIPRSQLKFTRVELGNGAYGKVSEVEYNGKRCACKELHALLLQLASERDLAKLKRDFLCECRLWSTLRHPNVVQFLGIFYPSSDESGLPIMVMEKMQDSVTSLVNKYGGDINLMVMLSILLDVSLGLRYLHGQNPPIVHRDLSPNNILVSRFLEAKITDLGVAKVMMAESSKSMSQIPGVILYIASQQWPTPKAMKQIDLKTRKLVALSEIERRQDFINMMNTDDRILMKPLLLSCLADDPEFRPSATDIFEEVNKLIKKVEEIYPGISLKDAFLYFETSKSTESKDEVREKTTSSGPSIPNLHNGRRIEWVTGASAPVAADYHKAVMFDNAIYVGGGQSDTISLYRVDVYHPDADKWDDPIDTPQSLFSLAVFMNNLILVGGKTKNGRATNRLLSLENKHWKDYTEMPTARWTPTAASHNSMMIVMGGWDANKGNTKITVNGIFSTTEAYDSNSSQWFKCDDLPQPLCVLHSAIVGNKLFVLGGVTPDMKPSSAVYVALLETLSDHQLKWGRVEDTPWSSPAAASLGDKYLIAVGGYSEYFTACVLNTSYSWESIDSLPTMLCSSAAVCSSHQIYVIGGFDKNRKSLNNVYIGTFRGTPACVLL
ncbi:probable serine/threonine-protein kinase pats1 isoform X2 [Dysidea avara]|uniref:probable serine/threonine-protein kinase pats1 isoform X2 n=1 Tax=Dysidea avara TaxID=196820 RepID=UPI0033285A15